MVDVRSKRCSHEGCNTWPSYGAEGSKKAEYCARHALPGQVDVCNKRQATMCFPFTAEHSAKVSYCN